MGEVIDNVCTPPLAAPLAHEPRPVARTRKAPGRARRLQGSIRTSIVATVSTNFATFGLTAVQGILLARLLGPEARGEYGSAILFTQTLTWAGMLGTQFAVARRAAAEPDARLQLTRSVMRLGVLTGLGTALVVAMLAYTTLPLEKQILAPWCALAAIALPFEQTRLLLLAVDQGSGAFRRYNVTQIVTSCVFPALLFATWIAGGGSVATAVLLSLVSPLVGLTLRMAMGASLAGVAAAPPGRTLVKEGLPYLFSSAVSDIYGRLDAFLFLWLASFTAQGFYAVAVPAASLLLVGPDALALFSFNSASRRGAPPSIKKVVAGGLLVIAFQVVVGCCFALVIGPLLVLLYGSRFDGALPFALALLPATALLGFAQVCEGYLRGRGRVRIGVAARLAAAAVMVATVLTIFGRFSELSIPIAASFAHGLVALTLAWFVVADVRGQHRASNLPEQGDLLP